MKAAVFSIGTELTRGELTNSNASWLSEQLTEVGCEVIEHRVVPDDISVIVTAMKALSSVADMVVATGGLGPTSDDLTAEAAARALGVVREQHEPSIVRIRERWKARNREMPVSNFQQAQLPQGAEVFDNEVGTAPAFSIALERTAFYFLPGVPAEMKFFFDAVIKPRLKAQVEQRQYQVHYRLFGHAESHVGDMLQDIEARYPGVTIGYRAHFPELEVKVLGRGADGSEAQRIAAEAAVEVKDRLVNVIYGGKGDTYPSAIGKIFQRTGTTIALAESCTGGLVGEMLTRVPGSSQYFLMSAVCYANEAKRDLLGVSEEVLQRHGAVSAQTAAAMAEGVRRVARSDLAVSITGIAGPGGGSEEKPVGTVWFGLAQAAKPTLTKLHHLPWDRQRLRTMAAYWALRIGARAAEGKDPFIF